MHFSSFVADFAEILLLRLVHLPLHRQNIRVFSTVSYTQLDNLTSNTMSHISASQANDLKEQLRSTGAEVLTPGSAGYAESIKRWSDTAEKQAVGSQIFNLRHIFLTLTFQGAVVQVISAEEVSTVIKFAEANKIPFVVHGGGHSTSGASATEGGIVISLAKMRRVFVDPSAKTITVEGGAVWEDVDVAAAKHGLATVGGTVNHTGVGGLTLGGGYGWLTGRYGLAIDNLLSVKMVLADGSIVTASETQNSDLFWAIRGAGQNFGVATEFVFRAHEQKDPVYAGLLFFDPDKLAQIVAFLNRFEEISNGDQGLFFGFTRPPFIDKLAIIIAVYYNGPQTEAESFFEPLLSLGPLVNTAEMIPYERLNTIFNAGATYGGRKSFSGANVVLPLDVDFVKEIYDDFAKMVETYENVGESLLSFEFIPFKEVIKVPRDATSCANRGRYYNVGSAFRWYDPALDGEMRRIQKEIMTEIQQRAGVAKHGTEATEQGVGVYANYDGMIDVPLSR
mgnify:CR=1 FL=1